MKQEDMFAVAQEAGFTRIKTCCEGVENKFCGTDEWRGNLAALVTKVERQAIQRCIEFIRNGSFLHDQSPAKRFATEVTAEMEKQLMPQGMQPYRTEHGELLEITPENFGRISFEMMKADPFGTKHNCLPDRKQMFVASLKERADSVELTEKSTVQLPWTTAVMLFRAHIGQKFMRDGLSGASIVQMLDDALTTFSPEVDQKLQEVLAGANALAKYERGYTYDIQLDLRQILTEVPEVGEDGVKLNKENP